jgi:hypothetical protein
MTQTGGFTFLIAWGVLAVLCGTLAYLVLRRPRPRNRPDRTNQPGRHDDDHRTTT